MADKASALPANLPPRLLSRPAAAAYCGISPGHFDAHCDVKPIYIGVPRLWDRRRLDEWIERLHGNHGVEATEKKTSRLMNPSEKVRLHGNRRR